MAYFNHAFKKQFLGTAVSDPFVDDGTSTTADLQTLGLGKFGFFDPKTWVNVAAAPADCCNLVLASTAIASNDKIGPFAGGYQESNKSKEINPKYVSRFYRVDPCTPQNNIVHIGSTPATALGAILTASIGVAGTTYTNGVYTAVPATGGTGTGATFNITVAGGIMTVVTINSPGIGYTAGVSVLTPDPAVIGAGDGAARITIGTVSLTATADCCHTFLCDETYYLRLDIKGSPVLRFLTRNTYYQADHYTGCCADPSAAPVPVDSTLVMIGWATEFMQSPLISPFINVIVWDQEGNPWFYTDALATAAGYGAGHTYADYTSGGYITDACAGMTIVGAYVDTVFGNCTFYPTDFFEKEPVKILASEVDYTGDPCEFTGICVVEECPPRQGMGFGDTVLKDLILSESYRQNTFATNMDLRIREITLGYDISSAINRGTLYTRYFLQHVVPRFNNPSGVFDNDQYLLEVTSLGTIAAFETFVNTWLDTCSNCPQLEEFTCDSCTSVIGFL